jgi:hypothetical protein
MYRFTKTTSLSILATPAWSDDAIKCVDPHVQLAPTWYAADKTMDTSGLFQNCPRVLYAEYKAT